MKPVKPSPLEPAPPPARDYRQMSREELIAQLDERDLACLHCELRQETLRVTWEHVQRILHAAPLGIAVTDEMGCFEEVNPAYCQLFGYRREELIGQPFTLTVPEQERETMQRMHDHFIVSGNELCGEWEVRNRQGEAFVVMANAARLTGMDGRPKKVTYVVDITEQKRNQERLRELACNDSLTGLLNHRTLREALARELERSRRSDAPLSVLMLDLDNFKQINDQRGHQAGDDVLRAVAEIIRDGIREADHAGRYGGEEFLVIFVDSPLTQARSAAERIRERIDALAAEGPQASAITVSGGLCQATPELQVDDLVRLADIRLYQAKRAGKNRIVS